MLWLPEVGCRGVVREVRMARIRYMRGLRMRSSYLGGRAQGRETRMVGGEEI